MVTGDDFGLASEVNRAIVRAHREGILTETSLMVTAPAVGEAVALARETPTLDVGLHLVLVQGRPASDDARATGLATPSGGFRESAIPAAIRYFFTPRLRRAVGREVRAQLERFRATGLPLAHLDGHLNVHLHPLLQDVLAPLVPEFGIPAMRLTREAVLPNLRWDRRHAPRKTFEGLVLRLLSAMAERRFRAHGVVFADRTLGLHQSGACDEAYVMHLIDTLPPGTSELYCHPAEAQTAEMRRLMPGYRPADELSALTSPRVRALVEARGVRLSRWSDLRA
ncbi:MAG: hopanoid biosynthesis-associated protein HpnK [Thermodesulfobacteriota bacterium]